MLITKRPTANAEEFFYSMAKENLSMLTPSVSYPVLAHHTFGRDHCDPPPLPVAVQLGAVQESVSNASSSLVQQSEGLPHDFDHLVRSIGEW